MQDFAPMGQTLWPLRLTRQRVPLLLLQALLTAFPDNASLFRTLCTEVSDWSKFFDLAEVHGVAGLLHRTAPCGNRGIDLPTEEMNALDRRAAAGRLKQRHQQTGHGGDPGRA